MSLQFRRHITSNSHLKFPSQVLPVSSSLHNLFFPHALTLLHYTRHFRLQQPLHFSEGPLLVFPAPLSFTWMASPIGQPWLSREVLSRFNILPCFYNSPSILASLPLAGISAFCSNRNWAWTIQSTSVGHRVHLGIIPTQPHFPRSLLSSYRDRCLMNN